MVRHTPDAAQHPRVLELARRLKEHRIDWRHVQTGDWFFVGGTQHVVMRSEEQDGKVVLFSQAGTSHPLDQVVLVPHLTQCREWLMEKDYDLTIEDADDGQVKAIAHRRHTDFRVERVEPNDLAAVYAVMNEVVDMMHFGWA
ncbi:hypothetical protein JW916_02520 [Candidatus Sumerlaeota bacterium]|nr:hypothetical protein [Candidatus Sumerlaeota bacterium]